VTVVSTLLDFLPDEKKDKWEMQTKEPKNGRLAMMATWALPGKKPFQSPVVAETPVFFQPLL
jgi:hypothetical protein